MGQWSGVGEGEEEQWSGVGRGRRSNGVVWGEEELNSHEHASDDKQVPQGNEDSEVSQAVEKFPYLVSSCDMLAVVFKCVCLCLRAVTTTNTKSYTCSLASRMYLDPVHKTNGLFPVDDNNYVPGPTPSHTRPSSEH